MSSKRKSATWKHFTIKDSEKQLANCNYCLETFSFKSSVSNLKKHLLKKHGDPLKNDDTTTSEDESVDEESEEEKEIVETSSHNKSPVWTYFNTRNEELKVAVCNLCSKPLSYKTSITNLKKHLNSKHKVNCLKPAMNDHEYEASGDRDDDMLIEKIDFDDDDDDKKTQIIAPSRAKSMAWDHFTVLDSSLKVAACNLCGSSCSYRSSVSNLMKHVRRKHRAIINRHSDDDSDGVDSNQNDSDRTEELTLTSRTSRSKNSSSGRSRRRSVAWLYFKCIDPEAKVAQCTLCRKLICHGSTTANLKKHLLRRHPEVSIPGRKDGSKRILLSSGGQLYEVDTGEKYDDDALERTDLDMDTVYLEDFDNLEPQVKKPNLKRYKNSSDDEVPRKINKPDSFDYFGRYITSLLKQLPKDVSNRLQSDFVRQIMDAQAVETQKTVVNDVIIDGVNNLKNPYSITITTEQGNVIDVSDGKVQ